MKIKLLDPPEGYEEIAEIRLPLAGEEVVDGEGKVTECPWNVPFPRVVVKRKEHPLAGLCGRSGFVSRVIYPRHNSGEKPEMEICLAGGKLPSVRLRVTVDKLEFEHSCSDEDFL